MIQKAPLNKAYQLIKKNRAKRKKEMYKLALGVLVDRTTAIYLSILGVYLFASFFILSDFVEDYYDEFMVIEEIATNRFWLILTVLPMKYIMQSFGKPGVLFSSSEYQLSILPHDRRKIWLLCVREKWLKQLALYTILGSLIILITPISYVIVFKYVLLLIFFNILMTVPQWKLYQFRLFTKINWLLLILLINGVSIYVQRPFVGLAMILLLMIINIQSQRTLFKGVNWDKVTEGSDFQLWTMWLVSKASEIDIKQQKKYSIFQNLSIRKRPFTYDEQTIFNRMWLLYFGKNYQLVLQSIGSLFILLTVFRFINAYLFFFGVAIVIHIYTSILTSFFKDQFQAQMIEVLPWHLASYKRAFFKWALYGAIIIFIPIGLYLGTHASYLLPFELLFICSTYLYMYHVKIDQAIVVLGKRFITANMWEVIGYVLLVGIALMPKYPNLTYGFIIIIWLLFRYKQHLNQDTKNR